MHVINIFFAKITTNPKYTPNHDNPCNCLNLNLFMHQTFNRDYHSKHSHNTNTKRCKVFSHSGYKSSAMINSKGSMMRIWGNIRDILKNIPVNNYLISMIYLLIGCPAFQDYLATSHHNVLYTSVMAPYFCLAICHTPLRAFRHK
jgi:hypothetical protein